MTMILTNIKQKLTIGILNKNKKTLSLNYFFFNDLLRIKTEQPLF